MNLSDFLSSDVLNSLTHSTVSVGDVWRIRLLPENGITPKAGDDSRNKFFVILGFDVEGNIYGGVVINSRINDRIPVALQDLQMPIKKSAHPFLDHNSFVDCSKLIVVRAETFAKWEFKGIISHDDVELIAGTLRESPLVTAASLARFSI